MKGRIYEKDWTYDRELDRAIATAAVSQTAEIEALTSAELTRLASSLKQQSKPRCAMRSDIKTPAR